MPKLTINGKEVEVPAGASIIEAFKACGEDIAHYCWHPGLSVAGVCRMCAVDIDGNPRPQIACNTAAVEGMKVNNTSERIKETVKWVLEFHLINHPLDCPICDQAGECGLQEYYMSHGNYDPAMGEKKVKKKKVVSLGERVVLDTERCILCSRCVRFTSEVSKSDELGIFNRGDHAEIGTHENKPLNNNYSLNTVDICPVGALTSKDFRFQQRVWFLKDFDTVCNGCSTGCNTKVYYNENGLYRVKPVYNKDVNGYWMCDVGRDIYKYANLENRLIMGAKVSGGRRKDAPAGAVAKDLGKTLQDLKTTGQLNSVGIVVTAQNTSEEYEALLSGFVSDLGVKKVFVWSNNPSADFDGILYRGDKNPNTAGLTTALKKHSIDTKWSDLEAKLKSGEITTLIVVAPENHSVYTDLQSKIQLFKSAKQVAWLSSGRHEGTEEFTWQIPMKTFVEKSGTFVNYSGKEQKFKRGTTIVSQALNLQEASLLMTGKELSLGSAHLS